MVKVFHCAIFHWPDKYFVKFMRFWSLCFCELNASSGLNKSRSIAPDWLTLRRICQYMISKCYCSISGPIWWRDYLGLVVRDPRLLMFLRKRLNIKNWMTRIIENFLEINIISVISIEFLFFYIMIQWRIWGLKIFFLNCGSWKCISALKWAWKSIKLPETRINKCTQ